MWLIRNTYRRPDAQRIPRRELRPPDGGKAPQRLAKTWFVVTPDRVVTKAKLRMKRPDLITASEQVFGEVAAEAILEGGPVGLIIIDQSTLEPRHLYVTHHKDAITVSTAGGPLRSGSSVVAGINKRMMENV